MKKAILLLCICFVLLSTAAAPLPPKETITALTGPVSLENGTLLGTAQYSQDDAAYIVKSYELTPQQDPARLIEEPFEQDGYSYQYLCMEKKEIPYTDTKTVTQSTALNTSGNNVQTILKQLAGSIAYHSDGYTGILYLDTGTVKTEARG